MDLLSELNSKANDLKLLTNELYDLKIELEVTKKELLAYQTPQRVSVTRNISTDVSPIKRPNDDNKVQRINTQMDYEVFAKKMQ